MSFFLMFNEFEDDPIFGAHFQQMRQMNSMMNSMFQNPFGGFGPFGLQPALGPADPLNMNRSLMPFGFSNMLQNTTPVNNMGAHSSSYSSSTVVSLTNGPNGVPQVYQASSSTRTGPGGIAETKRSYSDSVSGTKKMSIGHHIGERSHIIERKKNFRTGDAEENQELINLEEDEAEDFNKEFEDKAKVHLNNLAITNNNYNRNSALNISRNAPLALPSSSRSTNSRNPPAPSDSISKSTNKKRENEEEEEEEEKSCSSKKQKK